MKKLIVLIVLAAGLGGVGLERGWFQVTSNKADGAQGGDTSSVTVNVDKAKIRDDKDKVLEQAQLAREKVAGAVEHHSSK